MNATSKLFHIHLMSKVTLFDFSFSF